MRKVSLVAVAIVATVTAAAAQDEAPATLVDCWDGSFAYTVVALRPGDPGWDFRLRSHDETMFTPLMGPSRQNPGVQAQEALAGNGFYLEISR